mmetsp:Transcript_8129/g.27006  ORF Transcript_8129/g.27006 Transcript_8129/m.27006 type:complete len:231 (+) Transcript_8129:130-822(+)
MMPPLRADRFLRVHAGPRGVAKVPDALFGGALRHAVPDVQDEVFFSRIFHVVLHFLVDPLLVREEVHGVHVPLQNAVRTEHRARFDHGSVPIKPDHVGARLRKRLKLPHAPVGVENERRGGVLRLDNGNHPFVVRVRELQELGRGEVVRPRVEDLHHLRAAVDLVAHVHPKRFGEVVEVRVQGFRVLGHDLFCSNQMPVTFAFHAVRTEGPRGPHEPKHGALAVDLFAQG